MDVRQLAALVAVADHGTFSAAARALYTVQSNVSGHVARLERELGTTLVDRAPAASPTTAHRVVERARRILRELDDIAADVAPSTARSPATSASASSAPPRGGSSPACSTASSDHHPQRASRSCSEGSTSALLPAARPARIGAAIVHLPVDDPELVIEPLFAEDLVLVAHAGHPLAGRGERVARPSWPRTAAAAARRLGAAARARPRRRHASTCTLSAQAEVDGVRLLANLAARRPRRDDRARDGRRRGRDTAPVRRIAVPELPPRVVALAVPAPPGPERADPRPVRRAPRRRRRRRPATNPASTSAPTPSRSAGRSERPAAPWRSASGRHAVSSRRHAAARRSACGAGTAAPVTAEVRRARRRRRPRRVVWVESAARPRRLPRRAAVVDDRRRGREAARAAPRRAPARSSCVMASSGSDIVEGIAALRGLGRASRRRSSTARASCRRSSSSTARPCPGPRCCSASPTSS